MTIKVGAKYHIDNREYAARYTASVLRHVKDWQEGQDALANHPTIGPWLRGVFGESNLEEVQSIIREAEKLLGDDLPY